MTKTVLGGLPLGRVTAVGALKTNAALWRAPAPAERGRRGRRRERGARLPTPKAMHGDRRRRWASVTTNVYGRARRPRVRSLQAPWYGVLWYAWKQDLSFLDLVRAARATLRPVALLPWARAVAARDRTRFEGAVTEKKQVPCPNSEGHEKPMAA